MSDLASFIDFLQNNRPLVVLTGAGISAESGIPTYRDNTGKWNRSEPIKHQEFLNNELKRKRYWARSMVGWKAVSQATPNDAHKSLALLEQTGFIKTLITQNVDGLHNRAGSINVIDLHGRLDTVICLDCSDQSSREELQPRLNQLNPVLEQYAAQILPDGDADIDGYPMEDIKLPQCTKCHGVLKPDVVFFGANVPRQRVQHALESLQSAGALLTIGSSLHVYSGYRFCKAAQQLGIAIGCINQGVTRADDLFTLKWQQDCSSLLKAACVLLVDQGEA